MSKAVYSTALDYLDYLRGRAYKENTLEQYHRDLLKATEFFGADRKLAEIDAMAVRRFLDSDALLRGSKNRELAPRTTARTVRVLKHFIAWMHQNSEIDGMPLLEVMGNGQD